METISTAAPVASSPAGPRQRKLLALPRAQAQLTGVHFLEQLIEIVEKLSHVHVGSDVNCLRAVDFLDALVTRLGVPGDRVAYIGEDLEGAYTAGPIAALITAALVMGRKPPSRVGDEEFVRVKASRVEGRLVAVPLARGASLLNSVVRADGIVLEVMRA